MFVPATSGLLLACATRDHTIKVWSLDDSSLLRTMHGHTDWVEGMCLSPDGRVLASASGDASMRLWDVASGAELQQVEGPDGCEFRCVRFAPSGGFLVVGAADGALHLWPLTNHARAHVKVRALTACGAVLHCTVDRVWCGAGRGWMVCLQPKASRNQSTPPRQHRQEDPLRLATMEDEKQPVGEDGNAAVAAVVAACSASASACRQSDAPAESSSSSSAARAAWG